MLASTMKVEKMLELDPIAHDYLVKLSPSEALEFAKNAQEYNNIRRDKLAALVRRINDTIPSMDFGPNNCNTGRPHHTYDVGNENSRVIYVNILKFYMPADYDYAWLATFLKQLGSEALADESDIVQSDATKFRFRFFWD